MRAKSPINKIKYVYCSANVGVRPSVIVGHPGQQDVDYSHYYKPWFNVSHPFDNRAAFCMFQVFPFLQKINCYSH